MSLAPSVRTFSYEKRSTELIGPAVDNNFNACKKDYCLSLLTVSTTNFQNSSWISNNDFFSAKTQIND